MSASFRTAGGVPIVGHAALRRLAWIKLRAYVRAVRRRLSTPSGLLFGLVGLALMLLWFSSIAARGFFWPGPPVTASRDPREVEMLARGTLTVLGLVVVCTSLIQRGLYLPQSEIERMLSAPVARPDLVRYRMLTGMSRSLLFGLITGLLVAPRMPRFAFAFPAVFVAMMTLPVIGQACALIFGDAENRLGRIAGRIPKGLLRLLAFLAIWSVMMLIFFGEELPFLGGGLEPGSGDEDVAQRAQRGWRALLAHPVVGWLTLPFAPWAKAMSAQSLADFAPWFLASSALFLVAFEAAARIPIDFRELSLETSADVARRLRRMRSGQNAIGGAAVSERARARRVPWLFGRGPFGAVAWLKCCSIARKARGAILFAAFVAILATFVATELFPDPLSGAVFIALLGTLYLGSGLRFDFRADLDVMEIIKAWPLRPWRVFLATILPGVALLTVLIEVAIGARGVLLVQRAELPWSLAFGPEVLSVMAGVPLVCVLWLALDNAVFLVLPVRYVPGQSGAMHHTGRTMVLLLLRIGLLAVVGLSCAGAAFAASWAGNEWFGWEARGILAASVAAAVAIAFAAVALLIAAGGWALGRFDVARERTLDGVRSRRATPRAPPRGAATAARPCPRSRTPRT